MNGQVSNNGIASVGNHGIYSNTIMTQQSNSQFQPNFRWDPSNIRITSLAVEKTLEPLVIQITTLVNKTGPSNQPKGQSKKAEVLVATMERAIEMYIMKGQEIASESSTMFNELTAAIEDIRVTGHHMSLMSRKFVEDPCSSANRADIVKAARPLLLAVTRLLIVADMIDVQRLLNSLQVVENDLANLKNASSQQEVIDSKDALWNNTDRLIQEVDMRQPKDERSRFQLAAARAILKKNRTLLLTASKVYVRHPEISEAKKNRDFAFAQYCEAVGTINDVAQDKSIYSNDYEASVMDDNLKKIGKLALMLDTFDRDIAIEPYAYVESDMRPKLEASLERIITASAAVADFVCSLKDDCRFCRNDKLQDRQDLFVDKCNSVRQALQDLLSEYNNNRNTPNAPSEGLNRALEQMYKKTRDLRRHLRQAAADHVSYRFLAEQTIVTSLVKAAENGDEISVEEYSQSLRKNSKMLMDVAHLNCCMSTNEIGVDRVNHCIKHLDRMSSQVINAAKILARTKSKAAAENMAEFQVRWSDQVQELIDALHRIIIVDDLLDLSELHTREDKSDGTLELVDTHTETDEFPGVAGISNTRDAYRFISDEDKQKIAIYVENFRTEKKRFDEEVGKWDDNGNEIIAIAKKMCKIMMDMTDFTRGRGPLKTTMDVINAAKKISEYGTELDKIAGRIADQSPESETKRDLQGYLKEIALYCHQLNITSKVKAEVQNISGSLIVSGLDSATSLIQAAKNLMNAVVSTIKASWVASTMYNVTSA